MEIIEKPSLDQSELEQLMRLWNTEYPSQICYRNLNELRGYLDKVDPEIHLLVRSKDELCAWMILFQREQARWFAMIVSKNFQGRGLGKALLMHAKKNGGELSGWVIDNDKYEKADGSPYKSPVEFYVKNGFERCPEFRLETENMSAVKIHWVAKGS